MEELRRKIKIFWIEHGTPILFWTIAIIIVFAIIQLLNYNAEQQLKIENRVNEQNISETQNIYKENSNYTKLINDFLQYCNSKQIEKAYEMLSENCKTELYPTIDDFSNSYYNIIFSQSRDIEVKYDSINDIYQIVFYEDILESGKLENRDSITDYYKIEHEILEEKIYINYTTRIK